MPEEFNGERQSGPRDAQAAFERGNELARNGDLEQAEGAYKQADEQGHPTAAAYAGVFAQVRGEVGPAMDAYRRSDERGDGLGALRLGLLLSQRGDWEAAKAAFARADQRGREKAPFDIEALLGFRKPPELAPSSGHRSAFANPVMV